MNKTTYLSHFSTSALAAVMLLAAAIACRAQDETGLTAKVIRVKGDARFTSDQKTWRVLKSGQVLSAGACVQTAIVDASVEIEIADPSKGGSGKSGWKQGAGANSIVLMTNTVLVFTKLSASGTGADHIADTELDLRAGRVFGSVRNFSSGSKFSVSFATGVAGMVGEVEDSHGTVFVLNSSGSLKMLSGRLAVAIASENTTAQVVAGGQQFDPATGKITDLPADAPERKLSPR
jgi:hypothetical protein